MWRQLTTKRYWLRAASSFLVYLAIYTLVSYALREKAESFWTLKQVQNILTFSLFMSIIFAYRTQSQLQNAQDTEVPLKKGKWSWKDFFSMYAVLFLFTTIASGVLFLLGWMVLHFVFQNNESFPDQFLKLLVVTAVMTLLATFLLLVSDRFGVRWGGRST